MTSAAVGDDVFRMLTNLERDYVKLMHVACLDMHRASLAIHGTRWVEQGRALRQTKP